MVEIAYALYLLITLAITIWVARTLSKNGEIFLVECFGHDAQLARSTNHLLVSSAERSAWPWSCWGECTSSTWAPSPISDVR
jgi:hypothetical protein